MDRGLYSGVAAMTAAERGLDAIAANLANLSVNGYKRRDTTTQNFDVLLRGRLERQIGTHTSIDFGQGVLRPTENPYDLALSGPGFFAVESPRGEVYTRNGQFRTDEGGTLLTFDGYPLAWDGARGTLDPQGLEVQVDGEGVVWQGTERIGQLKVVNFADPSRLVAEGDGYWRAPVGLKTAPRIGEVLHKTLESSNVSAIDEMVAMIALQRNYESATRLMSTIDQTYRRLVAQR